MKKAFILIDYSVDFVADDGALTTGKPGQLLEESILNYAKEFVDNGDYLVIAMDDHRVIRITLGPTLSTA